MPSTAARVPPSQSGSHAPARKSQPASNIEPDSKSSDASEDDDDSESSESSTDSEGDIEGVTAKRNTSGTRPDESRRDNSTLPKYAPPKGMSALPINISDDTAPFEFENLKKNPNLQLWVIRAPIQLDSSRLSALSVKVPRSSRNPTGSLRYKSTTYDLVSAGQPSHTRTVVTEEGRQPTAGPGAADTMSMSAQNLQMEGGEEMSGGLRLLVPRVQGKGALVAAPIPISHQLLLVPRLATDDGLESRNRQSGSSFLNASTTDYSTSSSPNLQGPSPIRRVQPTHLLKFRNRAFGYDTPGPLNSTTSGDRTDLDEHRTSAISSAKIAEPVSEKKKKRKSDVENDNRASGKKKKTKA